MKEQIRIWNLNLNNALMSHDPGQSAASTLKGLKFKIWKSIVARCVQKELVFVTVTQHLTPHNQFTTDAQSEGERLLLLAFFCCLLHVYAKYCLDTEGWCAGNHWTHRVSVDQPAPIKTI